MFLHKTIKQFILYRKLFEQNIAYLRNKVYSHVHTRMKVDMILSKFWKFSQSISIPKSLSYYILPWYWLNVHVIVYKIFAAIICISAVTLYMLHYIYYGSHSTKNYVQIMGKDPLLVTSHLVKKPPKGNVFQWSHWRLNAIIHLPGGLSKIKSLILLLFDVIDGRCFFQTPIILHSWYKVMVFRTWQHLIMLSMFLPTKSFFSIWNYGLWPGN